MKQLFFRYCDWLAYEELNSLFWKVMLPSGLLVVLVIGADMLWDCVVSLFMAFHNPELVPAWLLAIIVVRLVLAIGILTFVVVSAMLLSRRFGWIARLKPFWKRFHLRKSPVIVIRHH